ncbi:hypothetical protein ACFL7E_01660 [Thermodesulfobacteriota bacterium]
MDKGKDHLVRRCPRLGGPVSFQYCRTCDDNDLPCWKTFDCWWEYFDVVAYLKKNLDEASFNRLADTKPRHKITSLVELIEQTKKRVASEDK